MFGHDDHQQAVMGAPQVQQPTAPPTDLFQPTQQAPIQQPTMPAPSFAAPAQHDMTQPSFSMPASNVDQPTSFSTHDTSPMFGASTAGPVQPPVSTPVSDAPASASPAAPVDHTQLADMKREALKHLEPLAEHLDGSPEETFRATMMMIQANDNHALLDKAFAAAKQISDDKERAQALLDFINELNYFSQAPLE